MHLYEFLNIINNSDLLWNYLCEKKVIRNQMKCPKCDTMLNLRCMENKILHCTSKYYEVIKGRKRRKITCNFKISVFHGTWFKNVRIDIQNMCRFIAYFLMMQPPRQPFLMNELEMNSTSVVDWTCRETSAGGGAISWEYYDTFCNIFDRDISIAMDNVLSSMTVITENNEVINPDRQELPSLTISRTSSELSNLMDKENTDIASCSSDGKETTTRDTCKI
ncbi:hypothetical protein ALC62_06570 [Cyphomyrmex costatus]|uniref:Uncharacterized protein n=1 Tax=Cyphomyrmex costatus TaxID=456900 RepID=A0A151IIU4_9HYME|nr:hypothetical protein ALC62_06570 [Cyphomyrmex costatus]